MFVNNLNIPPLSDNNHTSPSQTKPNSELCATINIENIININQNGSLDMTTNIDDRKPATPSSPSASLRSTSISISSIESDAVSSIIDSDIDEFEDFKTGCMLKKLGHQQATNPQPPPSHPAPSSSSDNNQIPNLNSEIGVLISQQIERDVGSSANGPQIASLSIDSSTDVTFGSKKYHRGPVTIQQILVEKPSTQLGRSNPAFEGSNGRSNDNNAQRRPSERDTLTDNTPPSMFHKKFQNNKAAIITAIIVILLTIIGIIFIIATFVMPKSMLENNIHPKIKMISRDEWVAQPPNKPLEDLETPLSRVIIAHTSTQNCSSKAMCIFRTRFIQTFNMESKSYDDIRYNFLVGGDGNVYVGRGWDKVGSHTKGYNDHSLGIALIGTFNKWAPPEEQLNATIWLLKEGVRLNKLVPDYKVYGSRQLDFSDGPGEALYKIITKWPNWSNDV